MRICNGDQNNTASLWVYKAYRADAGRVYLSKFYKFTKKCSFAKA